MFFVCRDVYFNYRDVSQLQKCNIIYYLYLALPEKRRILLFFKLNLLNSEGKMDRDILVQVYFSFGLSYQEIVGILASNHGVIISLRTLKLILHQQGLFRTKNMSNILEVAMFIWDQIYQINGLHGYRWMHLKCIQAGLVVSRERVRIMMKILDPEGVALRGRKRLKRRQYFASGPNFLWHLDSYDKLKNYGFCINGCIDGFSRLVIWLNVYKTSSDPAVIAGYYIEAVSKKWVVLN